MSLREINDTVPQGCIFLNCDKIKVQYSIFLKAKILVIAFCKNVLY